MSRLATIVVATLAALAATVGTAAAHPLGNVTTNTALSVTAGSDGAAVLYVLDLAEIPTVQALQGLDAGGDRSRREEAAYASSRCGELLAGVTIDLAGDPVGLVADGSDLALRPGEADLPTLRLSCRARTAWRLDGPTVLDVRDDNVPDRIGWREIVVDGDGTRIVESDVPERSTSDLLRAYPDDRLASPVRTTTATVTVQPGGDGDTQPFLPAGDGDGPGTVERLTAAYTDLVAARDLTPRFAVLAVLVAVLLGSLHALAPGHGKTVMAAYVVGRRGSLREALAIGGTVATTHTLGVLLLGAALSLSETFVPDRLFGWFEIVSGVIVVSIGVALLRRTRRGGHGHDHDHGHGHDHAHGHGHGHGLGHGHGHGTGHGTGQRHGHDRGTLLDRGRDGEGHDHGDGHRDTGGAAAVAVAARPVAGRRTMTRGELVGLGVAGGLVPSPSALVVLLGAVAIGRAWFGVALVVAYGIGLALSLVGAGLLLVRMRALAERVLADDGRLARVTEVLPPVTAAIVVVAGLAIVARGLLA